VCPFSTQNKWKCLKIETKLLKYVPIQYVNRCGKDASILGSNAVSLHVQFRMPHVTLYNFSGLPQRLFVTHSAVPLREPQIARQHVLLRRLSSRIEPYIIDPLAVTFRIVKLRHIISAQFCSHNWKLIICILCVI